MAVKVRKNLDSRQIDSDSNSDSNIEEAFTANIKRLMVIANPGLDQKELFARAAQIRAQHGCKVFLVGLPPAPTDTSTDTPATDNALDVVQDQLAILAMGYFTLADKLQVSVIAPKNSDNEIAGAIAEFASDKKIDLVIKSTQFSHGVSQNHLDCELNRRLPCNLLIRPDKLLEDSTPILAAIDIESEDQKQRALNRKVLAWAKVMAQGACNALTVISAVEIGRAMLELNMIEPSDEDKGGEEPSLKSQVHSLLDAEALPNANVVISAGDPARKILSNASNLNAGLVVVGSVANQCLNGHFNGNTAEKILPRLQTELLIIKGADLR